MVLSVFGLYYLDLTGWAGEAKIKFFEVKMASIVTSFKAFAFCKSFFLKINL